MGISPSALPLGAFALRRLRPWCFALSAIRAAASPVRAGTTPAASAGFRSPLPNAPEGSDAGGLSRLSLLPSGRVAPPGNVVHVAPSEGEVPVRVAGELQRVGVLEMVFVVVGRAKHRQDQLAARYRRSRDLYDLARVA